MKCSGRPNDYHLLVKPKFDLTMYDCQCKITNKISGTLPLDLIQDILDLYGEEDAKKVWWEVYLWIREQEKLQDETNH